MTNTDDFKEWALHVLPPEQHTSFYDSLQETPTRAVLRNPEKDLDVSSLESIPWCDLGRYLPEGHKTTTDPLWHGGTYYAMEPSSLLLAEAFRQIKPGHSGLRVLNINAKSGATSAVLSTVLDETDLLVSNSLSSGGMAQLKKNTIKWGEANWVLLNKKARQYQRLPEFFDVILFDMPCSEEAFWRRRKKEFEWNEKNIKKQVDNQQRLLQDALPALKPGGVILYCTRSFNPRENIEQVQWLTRNHDLESIPLDLPESWSVEEQIQDGAHGYQAWPHTMKAEGFFIAALRSTSSETPKEYKLRRKIAPLRKKLAMRLKRFYHLPEGYMQLMSGMKAIIALPEPLLADIKILESVLDCNYYGTELGMMSKDLFLPLHALAMSTRIRSKQPYLDLSFEDTLKYLKREPFEMDYEKPGWILVGFQKIPLGWMKIQIRKKQNHYPVKWRIRD